MGYIKPDPYNQPEEFGVVPVASVDWYGDSACYEFAMTQIWFDPDTRLFWWAYDSGCSCYAPFEYFEDSDLNKGSWSQVIAALTDHLGDTEAPEIRADVADAVEAILRVKNQ